MECEWLKRWGILVVFSCIGFTLVASFATAAEVSVEITDRGRQQIKIAIPPFMTQTESSDMLKAEAAAILLDALRLSGFFDPMESEAVNIEGLHNADLKYEGIQFKEWSELGARLLIKGNYEVSGDALKIECRVYDTLGGDFLLGKGYESNIAQLREVLRRFADEVVLKMTGKRGISSTKIVFVSDRSGAKELYQIDFDGENLTRLTHDESLILSPSVSPNGKQICYTSYKNNNPDLYMLSLDNQEVECIAMFAGLNFSADWSPDGRTLALTLSKDGNPELYLLDSISHKETRLTKNRWNDVSPSWSPDGMQLVYTADKLGAPQLYILKRGSENIRRLTFRGSYNVSPAWSPTEDRIAFSSSMDGNFNIYTVQTNGDNLRQLTKNAGNNEDPEWSPDGRYIVFHSTREGTSSIYIMNADGTNQRKLTDNRGTDLSPDWIR